MRRISETAALAAGAVVAFAPAASAGTFSVFDLASAYEGAWSDSAFTDPTTGQPVGGSATLLTSFDEGDPAVVGDEVGTITFHLGGRPGGFAVPEISLSVAVNPDGTVTANGVEIPELDLDALLGVPNTPVVPTPTADVEIDSDGNVTIESQDVLGFGRISITGTATADSISLTARVYGAITGELISDGGVIEVTEVVPTPGGAAVLALAGLTVAGRRRYARA